jgi:4-azaleucine resistance transporter AzlC
MKRKAYLKGIKAGSPVILGFIPVALAYAILARQAGFSIAETILMSLLVFAGSSQIIAVGMHAQGAGLAAIIAATFIINFRHLIMSTCVFNRIKHTSVKSKLLAAFGVTDESFAIFTTEKEENCSVEFLFGLITVTYLFWVGGAVVGSVAASFLPDIVSASLGIALYAMFLGLLVPNIKSNARLGWLVLLTALGNWALSQWIDSSWALIASTLLGAAAGVYFIKAKEEQA